VSQNLRATSDIASTFSAHILFTHGHRKPHQHLDKSANLGLHASGFFFRGVTGPLPHPILLGNRGKDAKTELTSQRQKIFEK